MSIDLQITEKLKLDSSIPANLGAQPFSVYLFVDNTYNSTGDWFHALYRIDIDPSAQKEETDSEREEVSVILKFPIEDHRHPTRDMKCAQLGSKLYFLGGEKYKETEKFRCPHEVYCRPQDVYEFDTVTGDFKKMDARLNAGKPKDSVVFAANGKLYALAPIPRSPTNLLEKNLFECFDPATNKWQVLDNLPSLDVFNEGIKWLGCIVMEKRQYVVLIGRAPSTRFFKFVYHPQQEKWTCQRLRNWDTEDVSETLSFTEAADTEFLYGILRRNGPPVKSNSAFFNYPDESNAIRDAYRRKSPLPVDGAEEMSTLDTLTSHEVLGFFFYKRLCLSKSFLRYVGSDHFCHIVCGKLPLPMEMRHPYDDGHCYWDYYNMGINITLFREIKGEEEEEGELFSFLAKSVPCQSYVIRTPFVNNGITEGCFVVIHEHLQKKEGKKKKKKKKMKKKNVQLFGFTAC